MKMNMAYVGDTVLEEVTSSGMSDEATDLVASARAEAIEALREMHRRGVTSFPAEDWGRHPDYWLGRLEGAILGLVVAMDLAMEVE